MNGTGRTTQDGRLALARLFIDAARKELAHYSSSKDEIIYRQACEKGWAAIVQSVMHTHGDAIHHHRDYSRIANELRHSKHIDLVDAVIVGDRLHSAGFYHGVLSESAVQDAIDLIEKKIRELVE